MGAPGLLAIERWQWFSDWTQRIAGSGSFATAVVLGTTPQWEICHWRNASATSVGTAEYRWPLSAMAMTSTASLEHQHTVHLRVQNWDNSRGSIAVGPATAIHDGGAGNPGNCYYAFAKYAAGVRSVGIGKMSAGVQSTLVEVTQAVEIGDVLSLGYQWDVSAGEAELVVLLNGRVIASATDAGGYRIGSLSGRPGVVGLDSPSLPNSLQHGAAWSVWWVTDGYSSWARLEALAGDLTGTPLVQLLTYQRYSTDPAARVKWVFTGEITKLNWSYKRNGGCGRAQITLCPQAWNRGLSGAIPVGGWSDTDASTRTFQEPFQDDWEADDWNGGDVTISVRYSGRKLAPNEIIADTLYRGRISKCEVDAATGEIKLSCEGLIAALDERFVWYDKRENITLRTALESVIAAALLKTQTNDGPLLGRNILGLQSMLDQTISMDYEAVSVRSVIDELVALLPDGMVYGVDANGFFFVQQQVDHYTENLAGSSQLPLLTFDAHEALSYSREIDFSKMRTVVVVFGAEDETVDVPEESFTSRVSGEAAAPKALEMYGRRYDVRTQDSIRDAGMAAKYAQAALKRSVAPQLSVRLKARQPIVDGQAFWETLTPLAPVVAIRDRRNDNLQLTYDPTGSARYVSDQLLRRFGDTQGWATSERGTAGGAAYWASTVRERSLQKSWLFHAKIRFDQPHGTGALTHAFIVGRPKGGIGSGLRGWGGLYWNGSTGELEWRGEDASATWFSFGTGIIVNPTTPAGAVVDFYVHRDAAGSWRFYNSALQTGSDTSAPAQALLLPYADWEWRVFDADGSGDTGFDGVVQSVYLIDTAAGSEGGQPVGIEAQTLGVAGFLSRVGGSDLQRNDAYGLLMLAKLNEPTVPDPSATGEIVVWTDDGITDPPTKRVVTWTVGTGSTQGAGVAWEARGYRLGEGDKRWGGPLVLYIDEVRYTLEPSAGTVIREMTLGSESRTLVRSIASLEREIGRQAEMLEGRR